MAPASAWRPGSAPARHRGGSRLSRSVVLVSLITLVTGVGLPARARADVHAPIGPSPAEVGVPPHVAAHPRYRRARRVKITGIALAMLGGVLLAGGATVVGVSLGTSFQKSNGALAAGGVLMGASAGLGIPGAVLWVRGVRLQERVALELGPARVSLAPAPSGSLGGSLRLVF